MSKKIVFPYVTFNKFVDEPLIKRLSLFYDQILIAESRFSIIDEVSQKELKAEYQELKYEKAVWEFLKDNEVVKPYPSFRSESNISEQEKELQNFLMSTMKQHHENQQKVNLSDEEKGIQSLSNFYLSHDIITRIDALKLRESDQLSEYSTCIRTFATLKTESKKSQVIQFILNEIPEPDLSTSWEQIIEYRSDEDVKNRYLALINWVNKVASSNNSLSEIKEEYDYLYSDYMKHFKLHKLKYNNSTMEVIINSTVNLIANIATGNYTSSIKDAFQFNIKNANLLKEEMQLPGKEIAYIFHTKSHFK